ncbi:MAG: HlyC/CorC family transporter [Gammaproteobacteria bacterium]|nr:MAG: HlyC/CorC family transporter [Gammaproteobacteria bacterium]
MTSDSSGLLFLLLGLLIILSGAFSASETAMMALNRHRLKHLAEQGNLSAIRALKLLHRPDRLLGLVLLCNNFVNIMASSIATMIALKLFGEAWVAAAAFVLTFVILIFAEVAPKTLAALHPERVAFPAAYVLTILMKGLLPLVSIINILANNLLKPLGVDPKRAERQHLSAGELKSIVNESSALLPGKYQSMLLNVLELKEVVVDDIMVPRGRIQGIDIEDSFKDIMKTAQRSQYYNLPVYEGHIDNLIGTISVRELFTEGMKGELDGERLKALCSEPYFIPSGTALGVQLSNFQKRGRNIGLVINEYGDIIGLVSLLDILQAIVGKFAEEVIVDMQGFQWQEDGSCIIDGSQSLRQINRKTGWHLPTDGPRTLNGLILEQLESIPEAGASIRLGDYVIEITKIVQGMVTHARVINLEDKKAGEKDGGKPSSAEEDIIANPIANNKASHD